MLWAYTCLRCLDMCKWSFLFRRSLEKGGNADYDNVRRWLFLLARRYNDVHYVCAKNKTSCIRCMHNKVAY